MSIFSQLYLWSKEQARDEILALYASQWRCILSFLYFANVMKSRLLEEQNEQWQREYKKSIQEADFLFADGIALQLFYRWWAVWRQNKKTPPNLNGTDFNPWFIKELIDSWKNIHIWVYTLYDDKIGKPKDYINTVEKKFKEYFNHSIDFVFQTSYQERMIVPFDTQWYEKSLSKDTYDYNVLLMSTWTPAQEIRISKHMDFVKENNLLVINAWWTIDYISWFEQRAPMWVVKARVLETFWRIAQNPKKNFKKFTVMFWVVRYRTKNLIKILLSYWKK